MERCWSIEPTSERIKEDITAFPDILQAIIDHEGCVVKDLFLRDGRHARRADDAGPLKSKRRKRQQKGTISEPVCHPDAVESKLQLTHQFQKEIIEELVGHDEGDDIDMGN
jgi:hypothetical protein